MMNKHVQYRPGRKRDRMYSPMPWGRPGDIGEYMPGSPMMSPMMSPMIGPVLGPEMDPYGTPMYEPFWNPEMYQPGLWTPGQWARSGPEEQRDWEYWQQMYPGRTREIQREVERQCDLLEYEGSVMYDEYPDRIALARICEEIYMELIQRGGEYAGLGWRDSGNDEIESMEKPSAERTEEERRQEVSQDGNDSGRILWDGECGHALQDLIEVLLYHEMHRRRHRRKNRYFR